MTGTVPLVNEPRGKAQRKSETEKGKNLLSLRVDQMTRDLIDRAAEALGQTRTEFMLSSARERATDVLLNQTLFRLNEAGWEAFASALDNPPSANAELKALLAEKDPWES